MEKIVSSFKNLSVLLCATSLVAACQKHDMETPDSQLDKPFEISAVMSGDSDSKVSMADDFTLSWDMVKGQETLWVMSVSQAEGSMFETVKIDGQTAVFGLSKFNTNLERKFANACDFNEVYPYTYGIDTYMPSLKIESYSNNSYLCDLSDKQVILDGDNMDKKNLYMMASADRSVASDPTPTLKFKNAVSLLSFSVASTNVSKIVVSVNCGTVAQGNTAIIAGPAYVYYQRHWDWASNNNRMHFGAYVNAFPGAHVSSAVFNQIEVSRENGQAFEVGKTYYIPVWPGVKTDLTVIAYNAAGEALTTKHTDSFTMVRSKVHALKSF